MSTRSRQDCDQSHSFTRVRDHTAEVTRYCANFAYRASFTYPGDAGAGLGCPQGHPESLAAAAFAPDDDASKVVHRIIALWRLAWHRHIAALQARATRTVATAAQLVRWRGARSWSWPWLPWRRPRSPCFPLRSGRCFRTWPPTAQIGRSRRVPRARHAVLIERHRGQRAVKAVTGVPPVGAQNIVSQINHFRQKKTSADVAIGAPGLPRVISLISCPLVAFSETTTTTTLGGNAVWPRLCLFTLPTPAPLYLVARGSRVRDSSL